MALVIAIGMFAGCATNNETVEDIVFMAGYKPQANLPFVGVYVADKNGYFEQQGLNVDIKHASSGEHVKLLLSGDVQFSTADAGSVLKQISSSGAPLTSVALIGQRGQQGYIALEDSNINSLKDWEGKTFGYKISIPSDYIAMIESESVIRKNIKEVSVGFDPRILIEGKVDILAVFKSNEPDTIRSMGHGVTLWDPYDYGVPTLGLTYITTHDYADENPELVKRFLKATLKGIEFAIQNPALAIDIVLEYAPDSTSEHQEFMLETEIKDATSELTDKNGLGFMADSQWESLYDHLMEYDALQADFDYTNAYRSEFVNEIYQSGDLVWP
mgnify:CR=1 FL=1|tara:strand:- start:13021 stop:14007 length:987 start_codon:yes stop_codon:yes gene_type:complete